LGIGQREQGEQRFNLSSTAGRRKSCSRARRREKHRFLDVFTALRMSWMKLSRKYPQRAIKIRGHFPQWNFKNSAPGVSGVDLT
jgi:hypothetical protein